MGITQLSMDRLKRHGCLIPGIRMGELGAQNMYDSNHYGAIAKDVFVRMGIDHRSFDITPHQGAEFMDLRDAVSDGLIGAFQVVTDFGTTEHVDGDYYQALKNIHDMTERGGLMIRENPKTGHWPGHGCNYVDKDFYVGLAELCRYEVVELVEEFAMGNYVDGGNVCAVLRKRDDGPFATRKQFEGLRYYGK